MSFLLLIPLIFHAASAALSVFFMNVDAPGFSYIDDFILCSLILNIVMFIIYLGELISSIVSGRR